MVQPLICIDMTIHLQIRPHLVHQTYSNSTFYFMTSDFRVYKVLDNNGGSAFSGSEPTSESTSPFASGGYVLKYMYTISTSDFSKFGTTDFIPVATKLNCKCSYMNRW